MLARQTIIEERSSGVRHARPESSAEVQERILKFLVELDLQTISDPPVGMKRVRNIFWDPVEKEIVVITDD